ncbi:MAG: TauD/TfdA family dioxygenase, partial [Alphaproteobacteria bacterium]
KAKLLATGSGLIEEGNSWGDLYWGIALEDKPHLGIKAGQGQNRLGKILMQVRGELRRGEVHLALPLDAEPTAGAEAGSAAPAHLPRGAAAGHNVDAAEVSSVSNEGKRAVGGTISVEPIAGALGAEIRGVDLARGCSAAMITAIRQALLAHLVVFIRGQQDLSPAQFLAFGRYFGRPVEYPFVRGIAGFPEIIEVAKLEHERVNFGGVWHSDTSYLAEPPMASMLIARELPPTGGDTLFANMYLAYETLSEGMRRMLDGLVAVNSSAKADVTRTREDRVKDSPTEAARQDYVAEHPAVRTHPETGRKALYVNIAHTVRFKDMSEEESAGILAYLFHHQVRPEFTCRFRWEPGSLAFWDNRAAQHNPINDYHGYRRVMHRITLAGDRPR